MMVEREDLREMPDQIGGPLQETQILDWITQVCNALEYLHSHNPPIIHRDIKPANIKITPGAKAMLVDFGIAKVFDPKLSTTMGARAFRPGYFPQEQYGMGRRIGASIHPNGIPARIWKFVYLFLPSIVRYYFPGWLRYYNSSYST